MTPETVNYLTAVAVLFATVLVIERDRRAIKRRLIALRRNAYLTDHDGVRRRYAKVAADVRDRAER